MLQPPRLDEPLPDDRPIGEIVGQLIDEAKAYASAEIDLAKLKAAAEARRFVRPAALGAAALLFVMGAVVVLGVTIALALASLIGPLAGGLIAVVVMLGFAGLLGLMARQALGR